MQNQEQSIVVVCDDIGISKVVLKQVISQRKENNQKLLEEIEETQNMKVMEHYLHLTTPYYKAKVKLGLSTLDHHKLMQLKHNQYMDIQIVIFIDHQYHINNEPQYCQIIESIAPQSQCIVILDSHEDRINIELSNQQFLEVINIDCNNQQELDKHSQHKKGLLDDEFGQQRLLDLIECTSWTQMATSFNKQSQKKELEDDEQEMEQFANIMSQMKNLRDMYIEYVNVRGAGLNDQERKNQAGHLIQQLQQMMGDDWDDDDQM